MNKKVIIGGAIGLVVVVIAIVLVLLFLGKGKEKEVDIPNNQTSLANFGNMSVDEMAEELSKDSDMSKQEIIDVLNTPLTKEDMKEIEAIENLYNVPGNVELLEDDNPNDAKYSVVNENGDIYDIIDPFLLMTDEEVEEYLRKTAEIDAAKLAEAEEEEIQRLQLEAEDLIPDMPLENLIDQNIINQGFEADIDPETGDIGYWNPNTEKDPLTDSMIGNVDWDAHKIDPSAPSSVFKPMDDPWAGQAELDYGGAGG